MFHTKIVGSILFSLFTVILSTTGALAFDPASIDQISQRGGAVTVGSSHVCAFMEDKSVRCWGDNTYNATEVPVLINPKIVAAGAFHTCALDDHGVHCWGSNNKGQTNVPTLRQPTKLASGRLHTCAIDKGKVVCWGDSALGKLEVPTLYHPKQIAAGDQHTCAIDDLGVTCWGNNSSGQASPPAFRAVPTQVSAGVEHSCAIVKGDVQCWGSNSSNQSAVPPLVTQMTQVSAGAYFTCAVGLHRARCWGANGERQTEIRDVLDDPTSMVAGWANACAIDKGAIKCWGHDKHNLNDVPGIDTPRAARMIPVLDNSPTSVAFDFYDLEAAYSRLGQYVYRDKKMVLEDLSKKISQYKVNTENPLFTSYRRGLVRLFSIYAIEPLIAETTSEFVTLRATPFLTASKNEWSRKFGVTNILDIELSKDILDVSFTILESNVKAAKNHTSAKNKDDLESLLLKVAQIKAAGGRTPSETAGSLTAVLDQYQAVYGLLIQDEKTLAFGKTIIGLQSYLAHHR